MSVDRVSYDVLKRFEDTHIHSLLLFNLDELPKPFMSTFCANFKLLKVANFKHAPLDCIPEDVGSLFHLRYLSLRYTQVKMLPKSMGKLQNLETLYLKQSLVSDIPVEINKLCKLRNLIAYYRDNQKDFSLAWEKGVKIQNGVGYLIELQKLYHMDLNHGGFDLIEELGKLRQLRKLGVKNLSKEAAKALCASIEMMNHLQSLDIASISEDEIIDLQSISLPPRYLQHLYIRGPLEKFPDWIPKLQHLVRLWIFWSRLNDDPLNALQNVPNLLELKISEKAYNGEQLHLKIGGFPKLKKLSLLHLNVLNSLMIDEGALPLLEILSIGLCLELKVVPSGIYHLRSLKELRFHDMPQKFEESLDPKQGQRYWIVEHVPIVYLTHKVCIGYYGFEAHILRSKHLMGFEGQTINQNNNHYENDSNNINA
ncbi:disease resistance protein RPM1-like [Quercus suber]|uniref:disease resistance protein RPM1-like n=1 Tax=Quercus suber TaxID=58331 RepID=UPI000CE19F78|nr:disease resistance protein RPM1-like [Quercus suber]